MKELSFADFREMLLYRRVIEWNQKENYIVLDNHVRLTIEMTDNDCCAYAGGTFRNVQLDAVITDVTEPKYSAWRGEDTYGCSAVVKMLHNQNLICEVNADADAGNGGYYFSVASFIVTMPELDDGDQYAVYLVGSGEE